MGLRVVEASALSTHDIDLKNKRINIHRTLSTDADWNIIMGNKTNTYAGKRILPIPDFLYPYIVEQMQIAEGRKIMKKNYCLNHKIANMLGELLLIMNYKGF